MKKNILIDKVRSITSEVLRQPAVQRLLQRYPKLISFVVARFDPNYFIGLPLTLVLLAGAVNVALLSNLTESVVESEWIVTVDKHFTEMLFSVRTEWLSQVLYTISWLGDRLAVFIVGALASLLLLLRRRWVGLVAFWLVMGGVGLVVQYGKKIISRNRPGADFAYYVVDHFSFPSGHATTAMALYGMLAYLLYRHLNVAWQRQLLVWAALLFILLVGFSRIYLGVHYLSDVLAGYLLGVLWLLVGASIVEVAQYHRARERERR
ncbi:phosphatase PAP2 family protein [Pontibacter mangrovi]|uniref:Phosphatase PAP2 family protein n=1 Tax=Pontibacter mangrovi TaxID=2589816 RepID=A0A501W6Q0_9BACT|nr:phosphatase PAP2 family protein [Pontibacter mangrovi]TPE45259.1 phosphatase PAP2 family protein [Pontibacter mangrovi]